VIAGGFEGYHVRNAMPFGFPSHQGLLAPVWRRCPAGVSVLALWTGALVPDAIDGAAGILARGRLGQWMGHSLLGLFAFSLPIGLLLTWLLRALIRRPRRRAARWLARVDNVPEGGRFLLEAGSVLLGALSHLCFDLISHDHSHLLWPWRTIDPHWFPAGWYTAWFRVTVPGYHAYGIGPHFVVWLLLSFGGAWLFFRYPPRQRT